MTERPIKCQLVKWTIWRDFWPADGHWRWSRCSWTPPPPPSNPPQTRLQGAAGCLFTNELLHHRLLLLCPLLHSFSACCGGRQQCCKTNPHGIGQNVDEKCSLGKKTQGGVFRPYGLISSIMVCWHNQGLNTGRPARCVYVNTGGGRRSCPGPDRVGVLATGSHEVAASIWNQVMERHLELITHRLQAALGKKWAPECRVGGRAIAPLIHSAPQ